jgi:hypothetical protein
MTERRTLTPEELQQILVEHERWLASDGNEGTRACLRGCDLSKAQLVDKQLMQANLAETDLSSADLTGASLEDADLTNAKLHEAKGLTADHLGGADLTGAQLPPHIATFRSLEYVAETSRNARVTFFTLLLVCT